MSQVLVEKDPSPMKLEVLGVDAWPLASKDVSEFTHTYEQTETCFIVQGQAAITPQAGEAVVVQEGDLVTLLAGLSCRWQVRSPLKMHCKRG